MTYKNPHLHMRWLSIAARFILDDVDEFVERMRRHHPEMVLFARVLHFSGSAHDAPYVGIPVRFWRDVRHYKEDPYLAGGLLPQGLALRVPWPEERNSDDPERLIGGRSRKAYEDGRPAFRRFGRTVYLSTGLRDDVAFANREAIAEITGVHLREVPEIRFFTHGLATMTFEILHDADDPDMVNFVSLVRHCLRGLGASSEASYDVLTREPRHTFKTLPYSKRLLQRCALEDDLYSGPSCQIGNRIYFSGPAPKLLKSLRLAHGLPYGRETDPSAVPKYDRIASHRDPVARPLRMPDAVTYGLAQ